MSFWADASLQAFGSLAGTVAGGAITIFVARWQTRRTIESQIALMAAEHRANIQGELTSRSRVRSAESARVLLERLADLYAWLPSLPDVSAERPHLSAHARDRCLEAMESVRRGMTTDLLGINDNEVRSRYRELVGLVYDAGLRAAGNGNRERLIRDVRGYLRYVQHTLASVVDEQPLPAHAEPPDLERSDGEPWRPPEVPPHWGDPADGS